jgi:hypothetical protein
MDEVEHEFEYKPRWWAVLFTLGHFALGAVACGYMASRNGPTILRVFYGVIGGLCIGFVALVGASAVERLFVRRRVALTPARLLLPQPGWSREEVGIDYGAITGLFISASDYAPWACRVAIDCQATGELPTRQVRRARFLYVIHTGGKRRIAAANLPSHAAFEQVCELLAARVRGVRCAGVPPPPGNTRLLTFPENQG